MRIRWGVIAAAVVAAFVTGGIVIGQNKQRATDWYDAAPTPAKVASVDASGNFNSVSGQYQTAGTQIDLSDLGASTEAQLQSLLSDVNNVFTNNDTISDGNVSDTLTSSLFVGSGSTTTAIDLATAEVAGTLGVANGGTGAATFTDGGILLGSGTGALTALGVATNGQIPIGDGATDPVLATITGTASRLSVANGAGSITLDIDASYVGQATITTLGTISTGTWQGTTIAVNQGGTGATVLDDIVGTANQVTVTGGVDTIIGGDVTLSLPQDIDATASPTFDSPIFTGTLSVQPAALDYLFTARSANFALQNQISGANTGLEIFTKDGDGTDNIRLSLWAKGTPADITNREFMDIVWTSSAVSFEIKTSNGGTGIVRPIVIYTGTNTDQLKIETDGSLSVANDTTHKTGAATAQVAQRFGGSKTEGMERRVIDETVTLAAAVSTDLTQNLPSGAIIESVQANIEVLVVAGGTSTNIGIGPTGTPEKYGVTSGLTQNLKIDTLLGNRTNGSAEDVQINLTDGGGTLGDTNASAGSVRVRVVFWALNSLDNA